MSWTHVLINWSHVLTTHQFWAGVPFGVVTAGVIAPIITARSVRPSDRRKAEQEEKAQTRNEQREDKLRDEESLYGAALEFAQVATEILIGTIDTKRIFNILRDWFNNQTGQDDPKAMDKFDHSERVLEAQKRIAVPMNKLKMFAPTNVLDAASRLTTALTTTAPYTTDPVAQQVARKAAGEELANFTNVFRAEVGKDQYSEGAQREAALSFLDILRKQTDDLVEESMDAMRAAGFAKTPWDNWERKTPRTPEPL
jgi:hypothetical protein